MEQTAWRNRKIWFLSSEHHGEVIWTEERCGELKMVSMLLRRTKKRILWMRGEHGAKDLAYGAGFFYALLLQSAIR